MENLEKAKKHYLNYKETLNGLDDKNSKAALMLQGSISALELLYPNLKELNLL